MDHKGLFYPVSIEEKDGKTSDCKDHTIRNVADQERHESVRGGSPDRRGPEACKEAWTEFYATGSSHVSKTLERPAIRPSQNEMQAVPDKLSDNGHAL